METHSRLKYPYIVASISFAYLLPSDVAEIAKLTVKKAVQYFESSRYQVSIGIDLFLFPLGFLENILSNGFALG